MRHDIPSRPAASLEERVERARPRVESLKWLLGLAAVLLSAGFGAHQLASGYARVEDVDRARGVAADRAGEAEERIRALEDVQARQGATLEAVEKNVQIVREQVWEIARTMGARTVGAKP